MERLARARADCADCRALLRRIFRETLDAIDVRRVFSHAVSLESGTLRVADLHYALDNFDRVLLIAVGKAAVPAAEVVLRELERSSASLRALIIGPGEISRNSYVVEHWPGSHPVPDASSREAAERIVELLRSTTARDLVLFVISGGASAMVELPLDPAITIAETAEFYRVLVHSGQGIAEMNTLRKHVSAVKGGRLAEFAADATRCTLLVSDVPEGQLDVIGSGPTLPDSSTREQCWDLLRSPALSTGLPARIRALLESPLLPETPKHDARCFDGAEARVLLSTKTMLAAAADLLHIRGYHTEIDNTCDDWDYRAAADYLLGKLSRLAAEHPRVALLSAGEVLVRIGERAGLGGRNQQFALYCAAQLDQADTHISVLSAGTDGVDGNSPAAGAIVDSTTAERARQSGYDITQALEAFDAYPVLARIGDAIVTGPTGNNVRDLRILIAERGA